MSPSPRPSIRRMRTVHIAIAAALVLLTTGCATTAPTVSPPAAPATTTVPTGPSEIAAMVCASEVQQDVAEALRIAAVRVETPSWKDRVYACRYVYPNGSFVVSVKELTSALQTSTYYESLEAKMGNAQNIGTLGQGAFITTNGSVVVRKDFKVLLVDNSALPARMSSPPLTPGNVAMLVAKAIIDCWTGS